MDIPRELLISSEDLEKEKELEKKIEEAIIVLSPFFKFDVNKIKFPKCEISSDFDNMNYNPFLNRVKASRYFYPFEDAEIGEEAGHFIHFKINPLFGRYSNHKGLILRQLIECVGRYSALSYISLKGEKMPSTKDLQEKDKETHEGSYLLAEKLFSKFDKSFLYDLSKMKYKDFKKLQGEFKL